MQHHIAEHIDRYRQMLIQHFNVEADRFLAGKGVHIAADRVDLAGNVLRCPVARPLEHHVLDEVRDAVDPRVFVPRAGLHPDAHRHRANVIHLLR
jgi:hypothetical protein